MAKTLEDAKKKLDEAVSEKRLTQEEADAILQRLEARIDELIDANLRMPSLNTVFNVRNRGGVTAVVGRGLPYEAQIEATSRENLFVLTSGQLFEGSAQLFEGKAFDDLLTQLREKFDFIIFDGAPVMEFPDAYLLAPRLDGVILVLEADRTSVEEAQRATHNLAQAGAQILGVVLNRQKVLRPSFLKRFLGASS